MWFMPVLPAPRKLNQKDQMLEAQPGLHSDPISKTIINKIIISGEKIIQYLSVCGPEYVHT